MSKNASNVCSDRLVFGERLRWGKEIHSIAVKGVK